MKNTLLISDWLSWTDFRPSKTLFRNAGIMIGVYAVLTMSTYAVVKAGTANWLPACGAEESILEYPRYDARGVIIDSEYVCGKPRRACTLKEQTAKGALYECPGLMRP